MVFQRVKSRALLGWAALAGLLIAMIRITSTDAAKADRATESPPSSTGDDATDPGESTISLWP